MEKAPSIAISFIAAIVYTGRRSAADCYAGRKGEENVCRSHHDGNGTFFSEALNLCWVDYRVACACSCFQRCWFLGSLKIFRNFPPHSNSIPNALELREVKLRRTIVLPVTLYSALKKLNVENLHFTYVQFASLFLLVFIT